MTAITIVPGIDGSDDAHWQTYWERDLADARRIEPQSWTAPDPEDWQDAIGRATPLPAIIVAHSLGCRAAARWAASHPERVLGLFLVAVPDDAALAALDLRGFDAHGIRLAVPTLVALSANDPFGAVGSIRSIAEEWGAATVEVGALGHINSASALGAWPEGRELFEAFAESL